MIVDRTVTIPASTEDTFARAIDIPFVSSCLPGVSDVVPDGEDRYRGVFSVKIGPVKVRLDGTVAIAEIDREGRHATLRLNGNENRIGGAVRGDMSLRVADCAEGARLDAHAEMTISGKLGQFGQAVILKKADQITEAFVEEFSRRIQEDNALLSRVDHNGPAELVTRNVVQADPDPAVPPATSAAAPLAGAHAMLALLRQGRELTVVDAPPAIAGRAAAQASGQLWITESAVARGLTADRIGSRRYVVSVRAADPADVAREWAALQRAGLDKPVAVALSPMAAALTDQRVAAAIADALANQTGKPVLGVATTPWSLQFLAPLARSGLLCALAGDTGEWLGREAVRLLCAAVAELRRSEIPVPLIAGVASTGYESRQLRAAGADAVLVRRRHRFARLTRQNSRT